MTSKTKTNENRTGKIHKHKTHVKRTLLKYFDHAI